MGIVVDPSDSPTIDHASMNADAWTHVAMTYDGSKMSLYKNGTFVGEVAATGGPGSTIKSETTLPFEFGIDRNFAGAAPAHFTGFIDEVRLWNVARSAAEIGDSFDTEIAPDTPGLVGYWKFDEPLSSQLVRDSTSNALHGTLGQDAQSADDDPTRSAAVLPPLN
jgi:hypothetical protein